MIFEIEFTESIFKGKVPKEARQTLKEFLCHVGFFREEIIEHKQKSQTIDVRFFKA